MGDSKAQEDLVDELQKKMQDVEPLPDELDFFSSRDTLIRYLKARAWNLEEAETQLRSTVEWRRTTKPLQLDCRWCKERPGYHSMRQVGFDLLGRPVIYSCFAQQAVRKITPEDAIAHVTYLIENAKVTMTTDVPSWVFVFDCTGMTIPSCNPKLGYSVTQIMSTHYPERLGLAICINHSPVFQGIWNAIKVFLHPNTASKMSIIRGKKKIRETFDEQFPEELREWLLEESRLNKQEPLLASQLHFWESPQHACDHDPRGCPSYVREYLDSKPLPAGEGTPPPAAGTHRPHPNILDALHNRIGKVPPRSPRSPSPNAKTSNDLQETDSNSSDTEAWDIIEELEIGDEYQIPQDATVLPGLVHTESTEKTDKKPQKKRPAMSFLSF